MNKSIEIKTEFIRLDQLLKFAGIVSTGGEAKTLIVSGQVAVNDSPCTQRGKKIYPGDHVELKNERIEISGKKDHF